MIGSQVLHNVFGSGVITGVITNKEMVYVIVDFDGDEKRFAYPNAFEKFLTSEDQKLMAQVNNDLQAKQEFRTKTVPSTAHISMEPPQPQTRKMRKKVRRSNVAFKCNYCDGGKTPTCIGFNGVCSDSNLRYNVGKAKYAWCSNMKSPCRSYFDGKISREELEDIMHSDNDLDFICYESQMLQDWKAFAGIKQKGKPMRLLKVRRNSLAVLTSREPNYLTDESRFIFAVFLVDESYEGDLREEGYVTTRSNWKISLTPQEAHKIHFWDYYINRNAPERIVFGSGLHRYLSDEQAAQILRDIAEVRTTPHDKDFARCFFEHFCQINGIDFEQVPPPAGALRRNENE